LKRPYSKPAILFDDFSLSSTISSGCAISSNQSAMSCGVSFGGGTIFVGGVAGCGLSVDDGSGACYHVPADPFSVFGS